MLNIEFIYTKTHDYRAFWQFIGKIAKKLYCDKLKNFRGIKRAIE